MRFSILQHIAQRKRLDFSKSFLAVLCDDVGGWAFLALSDEGIKIDETAIKFARDFVCDRSFAASHETKNHDSTRAHTGNSLSLCERVRVSTLPIANFRFLIELPKLSCISTSLDFNWQSAMGNQE
jgi:hypothetical protein